MDVRFGRLGLSARRVWIGERTVEVGGNRFELRSGRLVLAVAWRGRWVAAAVWAWPSRVRSLDGRHGGREWPIPWAWRLWGLLPRRI